MNLSHHFTEEDPKNQWDHAASKNMWYLAEAADLITLNILDKHEQWVQSNLCYQFLERSLPDPIPPPQFIEWAQANKLTLPAGLVEAVQKHHPDCIDGSKGYQELTTKYQKLEAENQDFRTQLAHYQTNPSAQTKVNETLYKMVGGMLSGGYGYNPRKNENLPVKEIKDDLEKVGVFLDGGTIRKHLKESLTYVRIEDGAED